MATETLNREASLNMIEKKLVKNAIEPIGRRESPIGLSNVVGAHGTHSSAILDLARNGHFSGGTDPEGKFFVVPNLSSKDWKIPGQYQSISAVKQEIGMVNPIDIAKEYAGSASEEQGSNDRGAVILFGRKIVELVEEIQVGGAAFDEPEPEAILKAAPPIDSISRIYPVDQLAFEAISAGLKQLRANG